MATGTLNRLLVVALCLAPLSVAAADRSVTIIEGEPEPMPQRPIEPPAPAVAPDAPASREPALPNAAELRLDILPGPSLRVGQRIAFKASTRQPGYLVLFDADAAGHLTQIYPSAATLARAKGAADTVNILRPDTPMTIPDPASSQPGYGFRASLPRGTGVVVAALSAVPVGTVDLGRDPVAGDTAQDRIRQIVRRIELGLFGGAEPATPTGAEGRSFVSRTYTID